jgi:hypothetical protein
MYGFFLVDIARAQRNIQVCIPVYRKNRCTGNNILVPVKGKNACGAGPLDCPGGPPAVPTVVIFTVFFLGSQRFHQMVFPILILCWRPCSYPHNPPDHLLR